MRHITYAVHGRDGLVISRVGSELAWPILDYDAIGKDGDFTSPLQYKLKTIPVHEAIREWAMLKWTRKIPIEIKNLHRAYWGMKPLKA